MPGPSHDAPRSPGVVYGVLVLLLLLVVGLIAFTSRQPPPPTIAEFAPQAVENITESPNDRSSSSGRGDGIGSGDVAAPTTTPSVEPIAVPRVRKCVGDPPRQIEDPQSPPCVPYWHGDNGGATSKGVSRDEIRTAIFNWDSDGAHVIATFEKFFNRRFEFYGRYLRMIPPKSQGGGDCTARRGQMRDLSDEMDVFAIAGAFAGEFIQCVADESARLRIVMSSVGGSGGSSSDVLAASRPFLWEYAATGDRQLDMWGTWACKVLQGRKAQYAPDPRFSGAARTFGLINQMPDDAAPLANALGRCGGSLVVADGGTPEESNSAVVRMRDENVSTVFCMCVSIGAAQVSSAASAQAYFPEWIHTDDISLNWGARAWWPNEDQRASLMGLTSWPAHLPYHAQPFDWAMQEVEPGFRMRGLARDTAMMTYQSLLLLASGIQMAGPRLTPETVERALHHTTFPNPPNPYAQGRVGFEGRSYTMIRDFISMWWSRSDRPPDEDEAAGTWCYTHDARRFTAADVPASDGMFQPPCNASPPGVR